MVDLNKKQRKARLALVLVILATLITLSSLSPVAGPRVSGKGLLSFETHVALAAFIDQPLGPQEMGDPPASPGGESWLENYAYRKEIPITGVSPDQQSATCTRNPTKDTRVLQNLPDDNYGSATLFTTRHDAVNEQRALLEFNFSSFNPPTGYSISTVKLGCYYYEIPFNDPVGETVWAYKLDPDNDGSDWVELQATWGNYTTAEVWDTAGGDYVTSSPVGNSTTVPASFGWMEWSIKDIVEDAIDNVSGIVKVILIQTTGDTLEIPKWYSRNYGTASYRPYLEIAWTATPSVPSNYKVYLDAFRGGPTVEDVTRTVNSKTYDHRVPFTITTNDALPSGYPVKVVIDTKKLVDAGTDEYFAGSEAWYAKTVEFGNLTGASDMKYWVQSALGNPDGFNTDHTAYWLAMPYALGAETEYTFYLYVDKDQSGNSTNHDPKSVWSFFEDFPTTAANLAAFLAAYDGDPNTAWETDPNAALVSVAAGSSVLHLDSANTPQWDGISASSFSTSNFRALFRYTETPEQWGICGMFDTAGPSGGNKSAIISTDGSAVAEIMRYDENTQYQYDLDYHTAPFIVEFTKYEASYPSVFYRDDAGGEPDTYNKGGSSLRDLAANNEAHKPHVGSYLTNSIDIDYIAVGNYTENGPIVNFPNILYPTDATVFLNDHSWNWPYDTAFTDDDGETQLYWMQDDQTELTKQPGHSMQATVRVTDSLGSNQSIYIYYGNINQSSFDAFHSGNDTFNTWDAFADATAWTTSGGSWSTPSVAEPVLRRGDVGNVGGGAGRLWARMPCVVEKATGDYRMIFTNTLWEYSAQGWPTPYRVYGAQASALGEDFGYGQRLFSIPGIEGGVVGYWAESVAEDSGTFYIASSRWGQGMELTYTTDFDTFTTSANGPFITPAWLDAQGNWPNPVTMVTSFKILKVGSTWWCIYNGVQQNPDTTDHVGSAYNENSPESWTPDNWVDEGPLISYTSWIEDGDVIQGTADSGRYWHAAFSTGNGIVRHWTLDTDLYTFPGGHGNWTHQGEISITKPPWFDDYSSPRFILDGSDCWLHLYGQATDGTANADLDHRWIPNYIGAFKSDNGDWDGNWVPQNTDSKYYQASEAAAPKAYVTAPDYVDVEIITEIIVKPSAGSDRMAGILFRYDSTNDDGYWAVLDNVGITSDAVVRLYKMAGGVGAEVSTGVVIEQFPLPKFYPGYTWRLRVQAYGDKIKVAYSPWGNEWITAFDLEDGTYTSGKVGVITYVAGAYFNDFRVREWVEPEPPVGEAAEEEMSLTNAPSTWNIGNVTEGGTYATGTAYFTVNNTGTETIDIAISATSMTGGTAWPLADSGQANSTHYALRAGIPPNNYAGNVTTTGDDNAVRVPVQYSNFYAEDLHWVFYSDNNDLQFRTSSDGISWSSLTKIADDCSHGAEFGIWFDGVYVHYVRCDFGSGSIIYYRRGQPLSNGTISWSTPTEEEVYVDEWMYDPVVTVDSNGYPYVAFEDNEDTDTWVVKSSLANGTWEQEWEYKLYDDDLLPGLVPLTDGKVYAAYYYTRGLPYFDTKMWGSLWNGSSWGVEEQITTSNIGGSFSSWSGVAIGDDIHIVFTKATSYDLVHVKRTYGTGWGSEVTVQASTSSLTAPALSKNGEDLLCFWLDDDDHVYYKQYTGGSWDASPTDWIDETIDNFENERCIQSSYEVQDGTIGVIYQVKEASPWTIRYAQISYDTVVTSSGASFISDMAGNTTQDWGMIFGAPTNFQDGVAKEGTVTLTATLS